MNRKSALALKSRDFHFEIKAVEKDGFFSGYGSVFGVVDSYREIVAPGAFAASLAARSAKGRKLPVLWQHRSDQPLGVYDVAKEDATGLYLEGRLLVEGSAGESEISDELRAAGFHASLAPEHPEGTTCCGSCS